MRILEQNRAFSWFESFLCKNGFHFGNPYILVIKKLKKIILGVFYNKLAEFGGEKFPKSETWNLPESCNWQVNMEKARREWIAFLP